MTTEILYYFRAVDKDICEVAKFVDGSKTPKEVYQIIRGNCNCHGAVSHKTQCKHMKMHTWWVSKGCQPYAIDWDTMKAYNLEVFKDA